ncbi:MAG: V-type ATP synthase subunit I [Candidatus Entotheonellia bacterium]
MSIVPLVKVTFYGPAAEKDAVLDALQGLGCLHLNDLHRGDAAAVDLTPHRSDARQALQYLHDSPVRRRVLRHVEKGDCEAVVREVIEVRDRSRALAEEREQLHKWIVDLEPWGDFELPDWAQEGDLRFWFYIVPLYQMERMAAVDLPWRVVARDHRFAYVVVLASDQPKSMPAPPLPLEPRSLSKLRQRLEQVERDLEELDYRRIGLTLYTDVLRETLDEADDRAARQNAARLVLEEDRFFAVQGWAPEARAAALRQFGADHGLAVTIEPPGPQDKPPTLLANPPALRGGEGLVAFYMTPAYNMWDPSKVVLFAFAVFFAMILADAGYGVLLGGILWAMWTRLGRTAGGRGFRGVMLTLVIFSIVYGVLLGSYFGVEPSEGSWLGALHILHASDQGVMMWLSIGVGAVHLAGANLVTAWRRRRTLHALSALGWAAILLGGFCVGLGKSFAALTALATLGWGGLVLGGLLVLLFHSERPFSLAPKQLFGRLVDGLKGLLELSKAFGDVLSYLRLFALGLAAIKLAEVFNHLAASSFESKGVGVLLGVLILLGGHAINLAMGIMGGVVHSLRLNLIEFFNWSLPEEGQRFEALAKKAKQ